MTRLARRLLTPASSILLGLLAGCASNPVGPPGGGTGSGTLSATSGSGASSGTPAGASGTKSGGAGTSGGGSGGSTSGSAASGAADAGPQVDAAAFCRVPSLDAGSLPFIVDTAYVPSGWMGDAPAYMAVPANPMLGSPAVPATTARMVLTPVGY